MLPRFPSFRPFPLRIRRNISGLPEFRPKYYPFINGADAISDSKDTLKISCPASNEYLCEVAVATKEQTHTAIEVGNRVFEEGVWSRADVRLRAKVLNDIAAELRKELPKLAHYEVAQTGRAIKEMSAQVRVD
jgi:acyl-CoA reductase-like NAD-dependent aldehyde dehydrogenase